MAKQRGEVILTPREEQVLRHLRFGQSNKEIATTLGIGEQAVKAIVSRLLLKFEVPNRTTLASVVHHRGSATTPNQNLQNALARSRELRMENTALMSDMRRELREFRGIRKRLLDERIAADGHDGANSTRPLPPPRPQKQRGKGDAR